jgi:hypothetical protein
MPPRHKATDPYRPTVVPHLTEMDRTEIYTSRKKSMVLLIGSIAFVALGIWLLFDADNFARGIGIASILFFGLGIFMSMKRLIKSEIALIIDPIGLNVNPKKSLTEYIKWNEILGFEEIKIQSTRIIVICVKDPEYWIDKEVSAIRKKLMQFNYNNYNSPFNIAASGLDISSNELNEKLNNYFKKYKNEAQQRI